MEQETTRRSLLTDPNSKAFINVRIKVKNPKLSNDTAWEEAQPMFAYCLEGYPEEYDPYLSRIQDIFNLRRGVFLRRIPSNGVSEQIQRLLEDLKPEERELTRPLVVAIRDFFDIPAPSGRYHRS